MTKKLVFDKRSIVVLIVAIQVLVMVYHGMIKEGYFIDEVSSYGLSNSYYEPFIQNDEDFIERYYTKEELTDYLSVTDDGFSYDSVYYNQTKDVHPPFYYFIFHTLSSLFPNNYSKWIGLSINILIFILIDILVYRSVFESVNREAAICALIIWGFSAGAINTITFVRMYALLSLLVLMFIYLLRKFIKCEAKKVDHFLIMVVTFLGSLTHYYFIIFAFIASFITCLYLLYKRKFQNLLVFGFTELASVILAMIFFPAMLTHVFSSYRGVDSFSALDSASLNITGYIKIVIEAIGPLFIVLGAISLLIIIYLSIRKKLDLSEEIDLSYYVILGIISILYFILITKIAPYIADRYIMILFPIIAIYLAIVIYLILKRSIIKGNLIIISICLCISVLQFPFMTLNYIYEQGKIRNAINIEYSTLPVVYFYDDLWNTSTYLSELAHHPRTYFRDKTLESDLKLDEDRLLVYIDGTNEDDEMILQEHFKDYDHELLTDLRSRIYLLYIKS